MSFQVGSDNLELGMVRAQVTGSSTPPPESMVKGLRGVGFLTLVISVGTLVYKPPHGVLFQRHVLAYYFTLVGIFVAGVVEVWIAFWVSEARDGRRRALGRAVLWASVVPLAAVFGIGSYTVLVS